MCNWGDTVMIEVPIPSECSHTGEFRWAYKPVDRCIAGLVESLNAAGLHTGGSCCGHGKKDGSISLHDGTVLIVQRNAFTPEQAPCKQYADTPSPEHIMDICERIIMEDEV